MPQSLLDKFENADPYVRLYAFNGFTVSMASEIEETMFWCFVGASGRTWEAAADDFYRDVRFKRKRELTDTAVSAKVAGTADAPQWAELNRRLQALLGQGNNDRNLVSHNAVRHSVYAKEPLPPNALLGDFKIVQEVKQSKAMVTRKGRPNKAVTAEDMRSYCASLIDLYRDLEQFLEETLGFPHSHPLRCEHR